MTGGGRGFQNILHYPRLILDSAFSYEARRLVSWGSPRLGPGSTHRVER